MLFKLLFIISIIFTTFSNKEIGYDVEHKLSDVNLIIFDSGLSAELDLDSLDTLNNIASDSILKGYEDVVLSYKNPVPLQLHFVNPHPRAPPSSFS